MNFCGAGGVTERIILLQSSHFINKQFFKNPFTLWNNNPQPPPFNYTVAALHTHTQVQKSLVISWKIELLNRKINSKKMHWSENPYCNQPSANKKYARDFVITFYSWRGKIKFQVWRVWSFAGLWCYQDNYIIAVITNH